MPAKGTVTIIAPDGSAGDIPNENVQAAIAAGGRIGIGVYSPDGSFGYVPHDKLGDALKAGATAGPPQRGPVQQPMSPLDIVKGAIDRMGTVTPEDTAGHGAIVNAMQRVGAGGYKGLLNPVIHPFDTAKAVYEGAVIPTGDKIEQLRKQSAATPLSESVPDAIGQAMGGTLLGMAAGNVADLIPQKGRAIATFENLKGQLANQPVNVNSSINPLLEMQLESDAGGTLPNAATKLLNRVTDPTLPQMYYPEAQRFVSNISRLSSEEGMKMTPAMGRLAGNLRDALRSDIQSAAAQQGLGDAYMGAVKEYSRATSLQDAFRRAGKYGAYTAAGAYGAKEAVNAYRKVAGK